MAAIGTAWSETAWVEASWTATAWSQVVAAAGRILRNNPMMVTLGRMMNR